MSHRILISFLFSLFVFVISAQDTLRVPSEVSSIQVALDRAKEGTTIMVGPGTYFENLLWPEIDGIKLIGEEGKENTFIDGQNNDRTINMNFNWQLMVDQVITSATLLEGLTIRNGFVSSGDGAGLYLFNGSPTLRDLSFSENESKTGQCRGSGAHIEKFEGEIVRCNFVNNTIEAENILPMKLINLQ